MDTTRNRSAILAQFLRASTSTLRDQTPLIEPDYEAIDNALASIEAVAEELEIVAQTDWTQRGRHDASHLDAADPVTVHSSGVRDLGNSAEPIAQEPAAVNEETAMNRVGEREPSEPSTNRG